MSSRTRPFIVAVVCGIVPFALASCSSDSDSSDATSAPAASAAAPAAGGATLTISGFAFGEVTGATAGAPIAITNDDGANHTVTADDGSFSVDVPGSGTATLTVDAPGTYAFHCKIHTSMKGSITVG